LSDGYDVPSARHYCLEQINEVLEEWECIRQVHAAAEDSDD
jgi:hypothetical protein